MVGSAFPAFSGSAKKSNPKLVSFSLQALFFVDLTRQKNEIVLFRILALSGYQHFVEAKSQFFFDLSNENTDHRGHSKL